MVPADWIAGMAWAMMARIPPVRGKRFWETP
jgi:hypothetical protein